MARFKDFVSGLFLKLQGGIKSAPQLGVSLVAHALVFIVLAGMYVKSENKPKVATVISSIDDLEEVKERPEELVKDEEIELDAPVSLTPSGGSGSIAESSTMDKNPLEATAQVAAASNAIGDRRMNRPLVGNVGDLRLDSNVTGLKGVSVGVGEGGDEGTMDRITQEILRQLSKNKCVVAWIMDSTSSLAERREAIAKRFDRIYKELDELGVSKHEGLLSAIVSVGESTRFMTENPTADSKVIRKAIRDIKEDKTGRENVFTAVRETAHKYRRLQTGGRRTLLIVLLTDEIGDDTSVSDEAVDLLKRNRVPLYAMGPQATFSLPTIYDHWVDPESKFHFWIPLHRGPYTRKEEILRVPFISRAYNSGFGPFAMTQVTRETGGIFFMYGDDRVNDKAKYDMETLMRYKANYGTVNDYIKEIGASPMRRVLMEVVEEGNTMWRTDWPHGWVHAKAWKEDIENRAKDIARFVNFADKAIPKLEAAEKQWDKETDPRWRANFDLTYARVLQAKVRSDEYVWACADFKFKPLTLKDPKKNNAWHYRLTPEINVGYKPGERPSAGATAADPKAAKADPNAAKKDEPAQTKVKIGANSKLADAAKTMLEKSLVHYKRVIDKHPGTPWATAAQGEMNRLVGIDWVEGFDPNFTLTPEERKKYADAAKRVPKK